MEDERVMGQHQHQMQSNHAIDLHFNEMDSPSVDVSSHPVQDATNQTMTITSNCNTSKNSDFAMQSIISSLQNNETDREHDQDLDDNDASLQGSISTNSNAEIQLTTNHFDDEDDEDENENANELINNNSPNSSSIENDLIANSINCQIRNGASQATTGTINNINEANGNNNNSNVKQVELFGVKIVALTINSRDRLCLAQISNTLLKEFSYNEIHNRRVALGITCVQCTPIQLEMLRRAGAMPSSSRRCGMITMREAERLCRSFLVEEQPPELPDNFYFTVAHRINYGCRGRFVPARYISSRAKCIECFFCGDFFSPNKFIFHSHRQPHASECNPPDSPNINSWRKHIDLDWTQEHSQEIKYAWEDVKSLFNGGTRKRGPGAAISSPASLGGLQAAGGVERNNNNNSSSNIAALQPGELHNKRRLSAAAIGSQCNSSGASNTGGNASAKRMRRAPNSKVGGFDHIVDVDGNDDDDDDDCDRDKLKEDLDFGDDDAINNDRPDKKLKHPLKPARLFKQQQQQQPMHANLQRKHHQDNHQHHHQQQHLLSQQTRFSDWQKFKRVPSDQVQLQQHQQSQTSHRLADTIARESDHGQTMLNMHSLFANSKRVNNSNNIFDNDNQFNGQNNTHNRQQLQQNNTSRSGIQHHQQQQQQQQQYDHNQFIAASTTSPLAGLPHSRTDHQNITLNPQHFTQSLQVNQRHNTSLIDNQKDMISREQHHVKQNSFNISTNHLIGPGLECLSSFPHQQAQQQQNQHQLMMNRVDSAISDANGHCNNQQTTSQQMALRQQFWSSLFANLQSANNVQQTTTANGQIISEKDLEHKALKNEKINNQGQLLHNNAQHVAQLIGGGGGDSVEPSNIFSNLNPLGHLLAAQLSSQAATAANLTPNQANLLQYAAANNQRQQFNNDNISAEQFMQIAGSRACGDQQNATNFLHANGSNPFAGFAMNLIAQQQHQAASSSPSDVGFGQRARQSTSN